MDILKVEGLNKHFGGLAAVNDLNMTVEKSLIYGLIGPNGAGKTTFFNLVSGLLKPSAGRVLFKGEDITNHKISDLAAKGLVRTFQQNTLFLDQTVETNVSIAFHLQAKIALWGGLFNTPFYRKNEDSIHQKVNQVLEFMGLGLLKHELAKNLPQGYKRSLGMAIAFAASPELLLLDEPMSGMNPEETSTMVELIRRLRDQWGITVLIVEHDMKAMMSLCDYITVLNFGQKIAEGTPSEIARNPNVIEAYLGRKDDAA